MVNSIKEKPEIFSSFKKFEALAMVRFCSKMSKLNNYEVANIFQEYKHSFVKIR